MKTKGQETGVGATVSNAAESAIGRRPVLVVSASLLLALTLSSGCTTMQTVPAEDFRLAEIRRIEVRFLDYRDRTNRAIDFGAGRESEDLYDEHFRTLVVDSLSGKGYQASIGVKITVSEDFSDSWDPYSVSKGYYTRYVEPRLRTLNVDGVDAILVFVIAERRRKFTTPTGSTYPHGGGTYRGKAPSGDLSMLHTEYSLFSLRLQRRVLVHSARTQRLFQVLATRTYSAGLTDIVEQDWRYVETERETCQRNVEELLANLPTRQ